jgi:VCBS repeat-containing protein
MLTATLENGTVTAVSGNTCPRGDSYARKECTAPERTVTGTVRVSGGSAPVVSVRTSSPIPKEKVLELAALMGKLTVSAPVRPGDVLAAAQLEQLTFVPARRESDADARIRYLPVFSGSVGAEAEMTLSIRGKENQPPVAEDFAAETYKNLPVEGKLKVKDPEGETMTFTVVRQPKRGQVEIKADGSFTYTPKKNKVGIDSFVYTAADASGKVSRETTVTVTIVKPTDAAQYRDTVGLDCRFAAEWMKNTGIFVGESLDGNACFSPDRQVSRMEFLAMLVRALEIPTEDGTAAWAEDAPQWLRPYLAAAVRSGLITDLSGEQDYEAPITVAEAEAMVRNALDTALETIAVEAGEKTLTRADAARLLYEASRLAREIPGFLPADR